MKSLFRVVSFFEGVSYLLLLFLAMPLKYFAHNPFFVKLLGMPHGVLFLIYVFLAFVYKFRLRWNLGVLSLVLLASVVPFGTFYIDKKFLRN